MAVNRNVFGMLSGQESDDFFGDVFVTRTISAQTEQQLEQAQQQADQMDEKSALPVWLSIAKWFDFLGAVTITCGALQGNIQTWEIIAIIALWGIYIGLTLLERNKQKQVAISDEFGDFMQDVDKLTLQAKQELHIPENALDMDLLMCAYKMKGDELKRVDCGLTSHLNQEFFVWTEKNMLCLGLFDKVWEIPLDSLKSATLSKEKASFTQWHKEKPPTDKLYKPYKITVNSYEHIFCKYYTVNIEDVKGEFVLLVPVFEWDVFSKLTGLQMKS